MRKTRSDFLFNVMLVLLIPAAASSVAGIMPNYVQAAQPTQVWVNEYFYPYRNDPEYAVDLGVNSQGNAIVTGFKLYTQEAEKIGSLNHPLYLSHQVFPI